jgi:predicted nucleic acid-binding protein
MSPNPPPHRAARRIARNRVPLVYWDSNVFIRHLKRDPPAPFQVEAILDLAQNDLLHVISSSICHVELLEQGDARFLDGYVTFFLFSHRYISLVALESASGDPNEIVKLARRMRVHFSKDKEGRPTQKTVGVADSIHLATAFVCGVDAFHTYDRRDKRAGREATELGLIGLNGSILMSKTTPLLISEPQVFQGHRSSRLFHLPSCRLFNRSYRRRDVRPRKFTQKFPLFLTVAEALGCGFSPCDLCEPTKDAGIEA